MPAVKHLFGSAFFCLVLASLATTTCGCSSSTPTSSHSTSREKRIIMLNNADSAFWDAVRLGIKNASKDLDLESKGYSASMDSNDGTEQGQIEKLRQYATQPDIAAVIIAPTSASNPAIADELRVLREKGVIIGCVDNDLEPKLRSVRDFYVGTNNLRAGTVLGTATKQLAPAGGSYVQFVGLDSQQNAIDRMQGFVEAIGPEFKELDRRTDDVDRSRARDNVRNSIDRYKELNILVGIWSYNAPAIVDVVKERGLRDKFTIAVFDAEQPTVQHMADGMIDVMVVQNPLDMGGDCVKCALLKITGDDAGTKAMFPDATDQASMVRDTGLKVVAPATSDNLNAETFKEFGDDVQFIKFPEFQAWMTANGLTSS